VQQRERRARTELAIGDARAVWVVIETQAHIPIVRTRAFARRAPGNR
jgi:hypothetical protein